MTRSRSCAAKRNHIKQGRMVIVAELYKRGWSIAKIANEIRTRLGTTCSTKTVWRDINDLLQEWRSTRIGDIDDRLQLELERIDDAVCELWSQWEKSKENWVREYNRRIGEPISSDGGGEQVEIQTVKRENYTEAMNGLGDPRYIAEIRAQLTERRKLLGLYAAQKTEVTGKDGSPLVPVDRMSVDEICAEIARIRGSLGEKQ